MKRLIALIVLLVVVSVAGVVIAAGEIAAESDRVTLTETVVIGDAAAAEGLTVTSSVHWDNHLFWTTSHTLGQTPMTQFAFSAASRYGDGAAFEPYLQLTNDMEMGIDFSEALDATGLTMQEAVYQNTIQSALGAEFYARATDPVLGIASAYNALYLSAPAGEQVSTIVYLKDYYDDYPVNVNANMGTQIGYWTNNDIDPDGEYEKGSEGYVVNRFREYFKIPVLEEETLEIHLTRSASGDGMSWGSSSTDSDSFNLWTCCVSSDTHHYFTFNAHTQKGKLVDTSEIEGGYGIYRVPYRQGTSFADVGIDADALEMVYPLTPGVMIEGFYVNTSGNRLLFVTSEGETTTKVEIIDTETMTCIETFSFTGGYFVELKIYEDYTVVVLRDTLAVLTETQGVYQHAFTVPIAKAADSDSTEGEGEALLHDVFSRTQTAFDGERLAVAENLTSLYYAGHDICGYYVAVYDRTGLLFYGEYASSLDAGLQKNSYTQYDLVPQTLSLSWQTSENDG